MVVLALAAGCQSSSVEPERLGTAIGPGGEGVTVARWSADGSEVYYLSSSSTGAMALKAVKTDGSGTSVLDDTKAEYWSLFMPPDGSALYYTATETQPDKSGLVVRHLYEAFQPKRLDAVTLDQKADVLAAAPDDHHVAVWSAGVVHEIDLADGSSTDLTSGMPLLRETAGNDWELTYSPAGDRLFFLETSGPPDFTGAIIDRSTKAVDSHALALGNFPSPNWSAAGLRVVSATVSTQPGLQLEDVATGAVTPLAWHSPHAGASSAIWSRDGARIITLDSWCTSGDTFNCSAGEDALYVVDVASGAGSLVARSTSGIGVAELSPDGHRIVYTAGTQLYVDDVP
jgi:Tol biopolymer transport system component